MKEYLERTSVKEFATGNYSLKVIENPERALTEVQKSEILAATSKILIATTGQEERSIRDVRNYTCGIPDRGRVLCLFENNSEVVAFVSFHLLNISGNFIRHNGSTILHAGSGHTMPEHQGQNLWLKGAMTYLANLDESIRPIYTEGFTQSPRFLKLLTNAFNGNVWPNVNSVDLENLQELQKKLLPLIVSDMKSGVRLKGASVITGLDEKVYKNRIQTNNDFDSFFYNKLGVNPDEGDFLHFVGRIPEKLFRHKIN